MNKIKVENICKTYGTGSVKVDAIKNVSFEVAEGEFVVILGASGAGKSTILNIMGGMDVATSGKYIVEGIDVCALDEKKLSLFRRKEVGFVFQFYNLMPNLTALENVEIAASLVKSPMQAIDALKSVGLEKRAHNFPASLSGGEQQRVAIARAIVKNPKILLCDEPTGALDSKTGTSIIKLLYHIARSTNTIVVIVTHNSKLVDVATRLIRLKDGEIVENKTFPPKESLDDIVW